MIITFDPAASGDLDDIFAWISEDNERAAYLPQCTAPARIEIAGDKRANGRCSLDDALPLS